MSAGRIVTVLAVVVTVAPTARARAYRPFDSTDADVADAGVLEIQLAPVGYRYDDVHELIVPGLSSLSVGFTPGWELVTQGNHVIRLHGPPEHSLSNVAVLLKGVLRRGSLQNALGPSVAIEAGVLLPGVADEPGTGATMILIASHRWDDVSVHVNWALTGTRARTVDMFAGVIVEGPDRRTVRPVLELILDHEVDHETTFSALLGLIWEALDGVSFDIAARVAVAGEQPVVEARGGLTWAIRLAG